MTIAETALIWFDSGVSVVPAMTGKRPAFQWKRWQHEKPPREMVEGWFGPGFERDGLGVICGQISGNLEMLELEGRATSSEDLDRVVAACAAHGIDWLWDLLTQDGYAEWTPSGGLHFLYRVDGDSVPGNTQIAKRLATTAELEEDPNKERILAETRGEGGFVVVAPSGGNTHPTGQSWDLAAGRSGTVPTITSADRAALHAAIRDALHCMPEPVAPVRPALHREFTGTRPGDDFMERVTWDKILEPHGWQVFEYKSGNEVWWTRPGKNRRDGHSATTGVHGYGADDRLYVFSSTVGDGFQTNHPYNKHMAYAILNHGGDISAATKDLSAKGFGTPFERSSQSSGSKLLLDSVQATGGQSPVLAQQDQALPDSPPVPKATTLNWDEEFSAPVLTPSDFLEEDFDFQGAGNLFAKAYEDAFKYCADTKAWWFWAGRVWIKDGERFEQASKSIIDIGKVAAREAEITEEPYAKKLRAHVTKMANAPAPNIGRWARSDKRIRISCDQLDSQVHLMTVANGILDVESQTLMPHDPRMLLTKQLPVTYDKDAQAPRWQAFLEQALPDPEIRGYLQRAIGHTLLGNAEQRALFLLHGPSGTGKSVFIRTMEQLFGDFAETATPATLNASSKTATLTNDLNDLKGKRFVSISELDEGEQLNESLVKRLTGGDTAKSRGLWQENSKWRVQFTMWLATNNLPRLNSDDNAIWRRVKPIHFSQVAASNGGEVLRLAEKIYAEEASGILNWALDGVRMYQEQGLEDLTQITEAVEAYRKEVDVVEQFMSQAIEDSLIIASEGLEIQSSRLYGVYTEWGRRNGMKGILSQRRFSQRVSRMGYQSRRTSSAVFWVGLGTGSHGLLGTFT